MISLGGALFRGLTVIRFLRDLTHDWSAASSIEIVFKFSCQSRILPAVRMPLPQTMLGMPSFSAIRQPASRNRRPKVQRHSPDRLLRRKIILRDGTKVTAEKHRGRLVVRVEVPDEAGYAGQCDVPTDIGSGLRED